MGVGGGLVKSFIIIFYNCVLFVSNVYIKLSSKVYDEPRQGLRYKNGRHSNCACEILLIYLFSYSFFRFTLYWQFCISFFSNFCITIWRLIISYLSNTSISLTPNGSKLISIEKWIYFSRQSFSFGNLGVLKIWRIKLNQSNSMSMVICSSLKFITTHWCRN